jgi:hypothetical protein
LKDKTNIHPKVNAFMLVDDSEARPLSVGSASASTMKALKTRPPMHKEHRVTTEKMAMTSLLIQEGSWKLWPLERNLATMDATRADVEDTISFDRHITLWVCLPRRRRCFMASELKYPSANIRNTLTDSDATLMSGDIHLISCPSEGSL